MSLQRYKAPWEENVTSVTVAHVYSPEFRQNICINKQSACKRTPLSNLPRVKKGYTTLSRVRACARTLHFCTFCFHNLHRFLHKQLSINLLPHIFKHIFRESVLSDWKEAENKGKGVWANEDFTRRLEKKKQKCRSFSKKRRSFLEKRGRKFEKSPTF